MTDILIDRKYIYEYPKNGIKDIVEDLRNVYVNFIISSAHAIDTFGSWKLS